MERRDKGETAIVQRRLVVCAGIGGRHGEKQAAGSVPEEVYRGDTRKA
jgi:hypothetical protein